MTSQGSISFDKAASFYDKTRSLSPSGAAEVTKLLRRELEGRDQVLEVGVGTGRIALPLRETGVGMIGLDLARNMLARLIENAGGRMPFPLVQGDASRLPFRDGSFEAAIASWVLHLIPTWHDVLAEMVRVVGPRGILLVDVGSEHRSVWHTITWKFREIADVTDWPRGAASYRDVDAVLESFGARARSLDPVIDTGEAALEEQIARLERGVYSVAWGVDEKRRKEAADELREWAEQEYGSITEIRTVETEHVWRAYDL